MIEERTKEFVRGMGFTFTPSRVKPKNGEEDYIVKLNQLLAKSGVSQNKFLEYMLKQAIEYIELKGKGTLNSVKPIDANQNSHSSINTSPHVSQEVTQAEEVNIQSEIVTSSNLSMKKEVEETQSSVPLSEVGVQAQSDVARRAIERARKTRLRND